MKKNSSRVKGGLVLAVMLTMTTGASAFYDANGGRWLSRDPIGERGGANHYATCRNDPLNYHDMLGLAAEVRREEVRGYANAPSPLGLGTIGKFGVTLSAGSITSIEVEVRNSGCTCCLKSLDLLLQITMYLPATGDILRALPPIGAFQALPEHVLNIWSHERVHADTNERLGNRYMPKIIDDCVGNCWGRPTANPWTIQTCEAYARAQVQLELGWLESKLQESGNIFDALTDSLRIAPYAEPVTSRVQAEYDKRLAPKIEGWDKKRFCGH